MGACGFCFGRETSMRKIIVGLLLLAGLTSGVMAADAQQKALLARMASIQSDPTQIQMVLVAGRKASFFCANCHGDEGISKTTDVPNLAGQNPIYLLEQIRKFGAGERKDPFMEGLIKVLSEEERLQIALFYASAKVLPSASDSLLAERGRLLYLKLCNRCHGDKAYGNEEIPRIAGQKVPYLVQSVTRYRDGTGIRNSQLMAIATSPLKNDEIVALANYLTKLP